MKKIFFLRICPSFHFKHPHPESAHIPFDIAYIINMLPKNKYKFSILDTWVERLTTKEIVKKIVRSRPNILLIDTQTPTIDVALAVGQSIKKRSKNTLVVVYGTHASFLPETFLFKDSPVDVCIIGEAEETAVELIENLSKLPEDLKKIKGLALRGKRNKQVFKTKPRKIITDLDKLPFMAHEYFLKNDNYQALFPTNTPLFKKPKWGFLLSSRGCPYACTFCSPAIRNSYGKRFRARSPKLVVNEMEYLREKFGVNAILFEDDTFSFDMKRAEEICDEIIKQRLNLSWVMQTRVDKLNSRLLEKLKQAGCSCITLGIESGSKNMLQSIDKGIIKKQIKDAVNQIKKVGIPIKLNFIVGFPNETLKEAYQTLNFAKKLNPLYAHFHYCIPYPGTQIYKTLPKNRISFKNFFHFNSGQANLSNIPNKIYKNLLRNFYKSYYLSFNYLAKHLPFHLKNLFVRPKEYVVFLKITVEFIFSQGVHK